MTGDNGIRLGGASRDPEQTRGGAGESAGGVNASLWLVTAAIVASNLLGTLTAALMDAGIGQRRDILRTTTEVLLAGAALLVAALAAAIVELRGRRAASRAQSKIVLHLGAWQAVVVLLHLLEW